jgi:hypothetical protein
MFRPVFDIASHLMEYTPFWIWIPILEKNLDELNWAFLCSNLCSNPNIIQFIPLNTAQMRSNCQPFAEELAQHVFHPLRVERLANTFGMDMDEYLEHF